MIIDDLDATYQVSKEENLELCSFFSACREVLASFPDVSIRVTIRTDVWPVLRRWDESLDKVEQYLRELSWSEPDFRRLLARRVEAHLNEYKILTDAPPKRELTQEEKDEYLINYVFDKRIKWGDDEKRTYKVIYTIAYKRPRWAIQLSRLAQKVAISEGSDLIKDHHLKNVWGKYGSKRIADLVVEHKHQCSSVEELLNGFRGAPRKLSREELFKWIKNHITSHMTPVVDGIEQKNPSKIAHFLYRMGFIVARTSVGRDFEHYSFEEMPDFLNSRTNDDFGAVWEIHPCYREALDIRRVNQNKRLDRKLGDK